MIDIQRLRTQPDEVQANADARNMEINVEHILQLDEQVREATHAIDELRNRRNEIAEALKNPEQRTQEIIDEGRALKESIQKAEEAIASVNAEYREELMKVPNNTHPDVPAGKTDEENKEIKRFGEPTTFAFQPKDHIELGTMHDLLDFERGADVAGSGFYYKKNGLAVLDFALIQFALQEAMAFGFTPMVTPDLARHEILQGTGYNPRGNETQIYTIAGTDLGLIATAEIPVAGYYRNHTFAAGELDTPKRIVAVSHCFRTEDGAYGRESRGLYRVHQFAKVELFSFCKPEDSDAEHELLLNVEEAIMQKLNIPYRVVDICMGDLGAAAYRKYDIEAWMPFKENWGEVTSASNCTDFQSRRLNIKYTAEDGSKQLVHTLNGTAMASSRLPIAIIENTQQEDGSIRIPEALQPYMLGITQIG